MDDSAQTVPDRGCRDIAITAKDLLCRAARHARKVPTELLRSFLSKVLSISTACDQARLPGCDSAPSTGTT